MEEKSVIAFATTAPVLPEVNLSFNLDVTFSIIFYSPTFLLGALLPMGCDVMPFPASTLPLISSAL
jgi:hypothetical protein